MNDTTDKAKDKIRKLLALSESNNANEAAVALERARMLMLQYNLEMGELEVKSLIIEDVLNEGSGEHHYETALMAAVARYNLCELYTTTSHNWEEGRRHKYFKRILVGATQNITSARIMIEYVFEVMAKGAKALKGMGRIEVASYKKSFCLTLVHRVYEMIEAANIKENGDCRALVIQNDAEVKKHMSEKKNMKEGKPVNQNIKGTIGGVKGMLDAQKVSFNGQIVAKKSNFEMIGA